MRLPAFAALVAATILCTPATRAAEIDATVPTYHADAARSGHYVVPGLTWAHAGNMRQDAAFDGRVPGNIYAQPLYWRREGVAGGLVIVATEDNVVAALDAITGTTVWQQSLGPAVPRSLIHCGNINPLGITGTPVIDERAGALYLDAMINRGDGPRHFVFGLSLADGAVLPGWPVDTAASLDAIGVSFDPRVQNQRGALTMVGDLLYVPYGGHFGACGKYHGSVVGFRLDKPAAFAAWQTSGIGGGNWAPGGIAFDGQYLFIGTGPNSGFDHDWSGGQAVIRLPPDLDRRPTPQDFFAVGGDQVWAHDLGGSNPLPIDLPEGGPHSALLITFAREGKAYLLDRAELGGVDHPLDAQTIAQSGIITSPATYRVGHDTMVAFQATGSSCPAGKEGAGVMALRITGGPQPSMQTAWCAKLLGFQEGAVVTTSDDAADPIVWIVGAEYDDQLHGFRGDNGEVVFTSDPLPGLRHFVTVLAAAGRLYVAGDGRVFAFGLAH
jgi:hypothetical protein